VDLPFATGYYVDDIIAAGRVECTNAIPEFYTIGDVPYKKLRRPPGIEELGTAGTKATRGAWNLGDVPYEVAGNTLYRIESDFTNTTIGTIVGTGRVSMAASSLELCIVVPGVKGYIYSVSGGLVEITDATYLANLSLQVAYKDGYFLHVTDSKLFKSNLNDGTTYDALDFASAEVLPDKITSIHVSRNQLYVGGVETIEPFQNIGGSGFPYIRIPGGVIPMGVKAKFSLVEYARTFAFIGGAKGEVPSVYLFTGSVPEKIANNAIDLIITALTDAQRQTIYCTTYAENGGFFLNVHFPEQVMTYDRSTGLWHERTSKNVQGSQTIWRVAAILQAYGKTIVFDNQSGLYGDMTCGCFTEYGDSVKRVFSTIPFKGQNGNRISFSEMEIVMATGTGTDPECSADNTADLAIASCAVAG